ncbi:hypothetical protein KIMH_04370 [Bombiscardovia apis]|uniref:Uncharacterized protein n=1 Tax=Bombiscardovia apis TaxID=2932182 RepID=A0ABN6SE81_9BIFI|nr:hypothetical protein KIMH_04370 [Bombiscardovia apis]
MKGLYGPRPPVLVGTRKIQVLFFRKLPADNGSLLVPTYPNTPRCHSFPMYARRKIRGGAREEIVYFPNRILTLSADTSIM